MIAPSSRRSYAGEMLNRTQIQETINVLRGYITQQLEASRERSIAHTKLDEVELWCLKAERLDDAVEVEAHR